MGLTSGRPVHHFRVGRIGCFAVEVDSSSAGLRSLLLHQVSMRGDTAARKVGRQSGETGLPSASGMNLRPIANVLIVVVGLGIFQRIFDKCFSGPLGDPKWALRSGPEAGIGACCPIATGVGYGWWPLALGLVPPTG